MNRKSIVAIAAVALLAVACDYQRNNTIKQKDVRLDDEYVYGVHPDSAAAQMKQTYTATPEGEARAAKIREKLYGAAATVTQGN